MNKRTIILAILFVILLGGCHRKPPITDGEIYKMVYEPESTYLMPMPHTQMIGDTPITTYTYIPMTDEEDWIIYIKKWDDEEQEWRTRSIYVSQSFYNSVKKGDRVVLTNGGKNIEIWKER